jgi:hypothetical protein
MATTNSKTPSTPTGVPSTSSTTTALIVHAAMNAAQWKVSSVVNQASKKLGTVENRPRLGLWALARWLKASAPAMTMTHSMPAIFAS